MKEQYMYRFLTFFVVYLFCFNVCGVATELVSEDILVTPGIAYQPSKFSPQNKLSVETIKSDLKLLRKTGFKSIVTYGSEDVLTEVPAIARHEGFQSIIMGIWDPYSKEEIDNAISQKANVNGYCVGNEGLEKRYTQADIVAIMTQLRQETGLPVTTSEPINEYLSGENKNWLIQNSDWLFPNAHPFWNDQYNPEYATNWIVARFDLLTVISEKLVIIKEAGFPSAGEVGFDETTQMEFFQILYNKKINYFYFEAFDQPWKRYVQGDVEIEAHWGLFYRNRSPKKFVNWLLHNDDKE